MNERFENIAEEAMVHVSGQTGLHTRAFSLEKFAELIVRECIDIADEYDGVGSTIVSRIKEHFGVEE